MRLGSLPERYRELAAYAFFGLTTVLVNTGAYWLLSRVMGELWANTIAFFIAVQYAYMTNTKFVFRRRFTRENFLEFWGLRIGTLLLDDGGMWLLLSLSVDGLLAKGLVNLIIIGVNYICSKFYIFAKRDE